MLLRLASDAQLVNFIRSGSRGAFEVAYDRHHRTILNFCAHLLGDRHEAEDATQQAFLSAYDSIVTSEQAIQLRPWLFTIARNRCLSMLRARREVAVAEWADGVSEGPASLVQQREDLRDLVLDVSRLPEDQRVALVMAELGAFSHDEIAATLEVPREKIKALVFQARASLVATRRAREADCAEIRDQLRTVRGPALRRGHLRRHLHECPACREYRRRLGRESEHARAAAFLPLGPVLALRNSIARLMGGSRATGAGGSGGVAGSAVKLGIIKPVVGAVVTVLSAASAVVVVHTVVRHHHHHSRSAVVATVGPPLLVRAAVSGGSHSIFVTRAGAGATAGATHHSGARSATRGMRSERAGGGGLELRKPVRESRIVRIPVREHSVPARPPTGSGGTPAGAKSPPVTGTPVAVKLPAVGAAGDVAGTPSGSSTGTGSSARGAGDGSVGTGDRGTGTGGGTPTGDGHGSGTPTGDGHGSGTPTGDGHGSGTPTGDGHGSGTGGGVPTGDGHGDHKGSGPGDRHEPGGDHGPGDHTGSGGDRSGESTGTGSTGTGSTTRTTGTGKATTGTGTADGRTTTTTTTGTKTPTTTTTGTKTTGTSGAHRARRARHARRGTRRS